MRLIDLKPEFGQIDGNQWWLTFRCPKCGPKYVVNVSFRVKVDPSNHVWSASKEPDVRDEFSNFTLSPSIHCHQDMHGPKGPQCGWHGHVINGEVLST